ncbi:MAG: tetraacyldisaccharide 4'-kinase [Candidatus Omnitrophota bacterium]
MERILVLLSFVYAAGVKLVWLGYDSGIRKVHAAPIPVISVGNITLGGTGKTPMVMLIAGLLTSFGKKPAVLTRGYGRDECRMLKDELAEVPVYTGQDRLKSAFMAFSDGRDVAVLDDGFQHRRIRRDLNILLVDARNIFGSGRMVPAGNLREPVSAASRADLAVLTKTDGLSSERIEEVRRYVSRICSGKPVAVSRHEPVSFKDAEGAFYDIDAVKGREIAVVCGIADPYYFEHILISLKADIKKSFFYRDHHKYRQTDIDRISEECAAMGICTIVTTAKDLVKMKDLDMSSIDDKILVLNVKIRITEGKETLIAGLNSVFERTGS